ncbi:MAG: hypothetical protein D6722_16525 [Bacteroidetes bacterium]|nr:MAG: hypothetical protein D6722_16525 [Bacteroidota bacterium]
MEDQLFAFLSPFLKLTEAEKAAIIGLDLFRTYEKGHVLLAAGQFPREGYFVLSGCLRSYYLRAGEEHTTAFFTDMTPLEYLIDLHLPAERQGPGSEADTLRALSCVDIAEQKALRIADIGCESGSQTRTLARQLDGHITAVDFFPDFPQQLEQKARKAGLSDKTRQVVAEHRAEIELYRTYQDFYSYGFYIAEKV